MKIVMTDEMYGYRFKVTETPNIWPNAQTVREVGGGELFSIIKEYLRAGGACSLNELAESIVAMLCAHTDNEEDYVLEFSSYATHFSIRRISNTEVSTPRNT